VILAAAFLLEVAYPVPKLVDQLVTYAVLYGVMLCMGRVQVDVHSPVFGAFVLYGVAANALPYSIL
jgi:hypothetical protein